MCFGVGCIMPLTIFFFQLRLSDFAQYQKDSIRKIISKSRQSRDSGSRLLVPASTLPPAILNFEGNVFATQGSLMSFSPFSSSGIWIQQKPHPIEVVGRSAFVSTFPIPGAVLSASLADRFGRMQTYVLGRPAAVVLGLLISGAS